jgi:hypothetical protein
MILMETVGSWSKVSLSSSRSMKYLGADLKESATSVNANRVIFRWKQPRFGAPLPHVFADKSGDS